jgi:hypothetical protein
MKLKIKISASDGFRECGLSRCDLNHFLHRHVDIRPAVVNNEDIRRIKRFRKSDDTSILYFNVCEAPEDMRGYDNFQILASHRCGDEGWRRKKMGEIDRLTKEIVEEVKRIAGGKTAS